MSTGCYPAVTYYTYTVIYYAVIYISYIKYVTVIYSIHYSVLQ